MAKNLFVIGATGTIGRATVKALSTLGQKVTAGVRNPDKDSEIMHLDGVTVVPADMGKPTELVKTLKGVDVLFIVTPGIMERVKVTVDTAQAAKDAGVKRLLVVSVPTAVLPETIFGKQFIEIESKTSAMGIPVTFIRLPFFTDNYMSFHATIKSQSTIYWPADPTKPYTPVASADAGLAAATIMMSPEKHAGKAYYITSGRHTFNEFVDALSKVLGKEVKYIKLTHDQFKSSMMQNGLPDWQVNGMLELMVAHDQGHPVANHPDINDFEKITGKTPTNIECWVQKYASVFK